MRTSHISPRGALALAVADAMQRYEDRVPVHDQVGILVDLLMIRMALIEDTTQRAQAAAYMTNRVIQTARGK